jgi:hypothetical protein
MTARTFNDCARLERFASAVRVLGVRHDAGTPLGGLDGSITRTVTASATILAGAAAVTRPAGSPVRAQRR